MSKLSDFKTDVSFAKDERKMQLITTREPFDVVQVYLDTTGPYAPRWVLTCRDDNDALFRISLSATDSHTEMFESMVDVVSSTNPLERVVLIEVPTKAGRNFRTLEEA